MDQVCELPHRVLPRHLDSLLAGADHEGLTIGDSNPRSRFRNQEAVPRIEPPGAVRGRMQRQNRRASLLRRKEDSPLELSPRSARAVRCKGNRAAFSQRLDRTDECPHPAAGAGSARLAIADAPGKFRQILPVPGFAHHDRDLASAMPPEEGQQRIVPQQEHMGPAGIRQRAPSLFPERFHSPGSGQQSDDRARNPDRRPR